MRAPLKAIFGLKSVSSEPIISRPVIVRLTSVALWQHDRMDFINWFMVVLILVVLFGGISVVGALRRIRDATEKMLAILEAQVVAGNVGESSD